jgi:calmodulin
MGDSEADIIAAFKEFDKSGTGKLDAEEFRYIMTTIGEKYTDAEYDELLADAGGGSKIDYAKFVKEMNAKAKDDPEE